MNFDFDVDNETERIFEIVVYFLQHYFGYTEERAIEIVNSYYLQWQHIHDDDYYHHISAYHSAVRIHYFIGLNGTQTDFLGWQRENGFNKTPNNAGEYFRNHYIKWIRDSSQK